MKLWYHQQLPTVKSCCYMMTLLTNNEPLVFGTKASQIIKNETEPSAHEPIISSNEDGNVCMQTNPTETSLASLYHSTRLICDAIDVFCSKNIQSNFLTHKENTNQLGCGCFFEIQPSHHHQCIWLYHSVARNSGYINTKSITKQML